MKRTFVIFLILSCTLMLVLPVFYKKFDIFTTQKTDSLNSLEQLHQKSCNSSACIEKLIQAHGAQPVDTQTDNANTTLVVFIHGTLGLKSNASLSTALYLFHDCFTNSSYKKTVDLLREDETFYYHQPMQEEGLMPINLANKQRGAAVFAHLYDHVARYTTTQKPTFYSGTDTLYYTFGWSGMLSPTARYYAAHKLAYQLKQELITLHKQGIINPQIHLICYSHGGNVALNLGRVMQETASELPFTIDQLVLLGTPIQPETSSYIYSPLFTSIYNIYSRGDCIQCSDCFSIHRLCSRRKFKPYKQPLPKKLIQIEVKIKVPSESKCYSCAPHNPRLIDRSPGHTELWSFGWAGDCFREHFPLFPLPLALFVPEFIACAQEAQTLKSPFLVIALDPVHNTAHVRKLHSKEKVTVPFLSPEIMQSLKNYAHAHKPENFKEIYEERIREITQQVRCS